MGRTAKTAAEKSLQNRKSKRPDPEAAPPADPAPVSIADIPSPPAHLNYYAKAEWKVIVPEIMLFGISIKSNRSLIAAACVAYGKFRKAEKVLDQEGYTTMSPNGYEMPSPYVAISNKSLELYHKILKEFGLTPGARQKLNLKPPPVKDDYDEWNKRKQKADTARKKTSKITDTCKKAPKKTGSRKKTAEKTVAAKRLK